MHEKDEVREFMLAHGYKEKITPVKHFFCPKCDKFIEAFPCPFCNHTERKICLREYFKFEKA